MGSRGRGELASFVPGSGRAREVSPRKESRRNSGYHGRTSLPQPPNPKYRMFSAIRGQFSGLCFWGVWGSRPQKARVNPQV